MQKRFFLILGITMLSIIMAISIILFFLIDVKKDKINYVDMSNDRLSELTGWSIPDGIEINYAIIDEYYSEEHSFCMLKQPLFIKATIEASKFNSFLNHIKQNSMKNSTDQYVIPDKVFEKTPIEVDYTFYTFNNIECMCEGENHNKHILTEGVIYTDGEQFVMYLQIIELDRRMVC
ncbi:MAG: hypothetical protein IKL36_07880 [Clostridia bacterium]|nr:hypothetical protein [Clostridia bacterium]